MDILIAILLFFILLYSIFGGLYIFGEYSSSKYTSKDEIEIQKQFSASNKKFFIKLVKYSVIVFFLSYCLVKIATYFNLFYFETEYYYTMLAVPIFLWANTLIIMICLFLGFLSKKIKTIIKK